VANSTTAASRLPFVIVSNGVLRVAGGASSVLVGVYVADLANRGFTMGAGLVGTLAAMSYGAELAFCTFPDKPRAAQEFMRVLKPGGRVGLRHITRAAGPPGELADLMAWIACLADARPAVSYGAWLTGAGFTNVAVEPHDQVLLDMIRSIGGRLLPPRYWPDSRPST
jgi:SAM-dependent methyltransferase